MKRLIAAALFGPALATIVASVAFDLLTRRLFAIKLPGLFWSWWVYLLAGAPYPGDARALAISAIIGGGVVGFVMALPRRKAVTPSRLIPRGTSGIHGDSDWMPMDEAEKMLCGSKDGVQIVIGAAVRPDLTPVAAKRLDFSDPTTWGPAPTAPLLIDSCKRGASHSLQILAPGAGKTVVATTTIDLWGPGLFVLDPACELADLTRGIQEDKGHQVHVLEPNGSVGFNALGWIDIDDPLAEVNVRTTVGRAYGKTTSRPGETSEQSAYFRDQGKNIVVCLLAHMLWSDIPPELKTLRAVRAGLTVPERELRDMLEGIYLTSSSQLARDLAGPLYGMVPETFDGITSNAQQGTAWLSVAAYANMVSGNDYNPDHLCNGNLSVYCQIPMKALDETPEVARVVVGSHLGAVFEREGAVDGRVLFLLDEAVLLGPMKALTTARDQGRKYKITLQMLYQSEGQALDVWGRDGWRAWCDAVSWRMYGTVSDLQTARDLSATIGAFGAVAQSRGKNRGRSGRLGDVGSSSTGSNTNEHEVSRPLMHPFELMRMRDDARVVLYRGELPIYCTAAIGYMRPGLKRRLGSNRYRPAAE